MTGNRFESIDFTDYLNAHDQKSLLRFITCGSVDDGKSTLIGRLLYETKMIYEDQLQALSHDSKKYGTTDNTLDFALLVDGLASEREQGITIDVAYRYFFTDKRKFIVADTPGHEQYTRNMVTGASSAELAIVLIDARKGVLTQTKRHSFIASLLGIKHLILAVNKMDLVNYDQALFRRIEEDYRDFASALKFTDITLLPVSALNGDNVISPSMQMPWYQGPTLIQCLENSAVESALEKKAFRMPIQWVNRANMDFRGYTGRICSGVIQKGARVKLLPSGKETAVNKILFDKQELDKACAGQSITLTLEDELDISRGDVITVQDNPCDVADQFETKLIWLDEKAMVAGRQYLLKTASSSVICTPKKPKYRIDINNMEQLAAKELKMNEVGCCEIALDRVIAFEPYEDNHELGSFILIDRMTYATVAAGLINFALNRSINVFKHDLLVDKSKRCSIKNQNGLVLWLTGLSASGKSTIANLVEQKLNELGKHTMLLDGDNIRHGLNRDLGFSEADRAENIRRIAEVAKLMTEAGLITIVSFISPYIAEREMAQNLIGKSNFFEFFVDAPLEVVEERDPKGLYRKARAGEIKNFTGIGSIYEKPLAPDLHIDTAIYSQEESAKQVLDFLKNKNIIG